MPSRIPIRYHPVWGPNREAELGQPLCSKVPRILEANITISEKDTFAAFVSEFIRREGSLAFRARHLCAAKINFLKLGLLARKIELVQRLRYVCQAVRTARLQRRRIFRNYCDLRINKNDTASKSRFRVFARLKWLQRRITDAEKSFLAEYTFKFTNDLFSQKKIGYSPDILGPLRFRIQRHQVRIRVAHRPIISTGRCSLNRPHPRPRSGRAMVAVDLQSTVTVQNNPRRVATLEIL
jgi:hypothetical protein